MATSISHADRLSQQIQALHEYSACDVSDALLKLQKTAPGQVARGGYLADIVPYAPASPFSPSGSSLNEPKVIAPASTLKLIRKTEGSLDPGMVLSAIPRNKHWVDMTESGTIVVIDQPAGQSCAAIGGIMANRMQVRGVAACVVGGRVRDLAELKASGLPVFALGRSTVGTGAEATVLARNCPIKVQGVEINPVSTTNLALDFHSPPHLPSPAPSSPATSLETKTHPTSQLTQGDIMFCCPLEGVVAIPGPLLNDLLALMPTLVQADEKVKQDVLNGGTVFDAFRKHRS